MRRSDTQSTTASSTNTPPLPYITYYPRRLAPNHRSRRDYHIRWHDSMRQYLDVLLNDGKSTDTAVLANMHM